ncbi:Gfo/Idh/MocA family protein [Cognatiluteimonas telluris]|jgi:predicted dehydrogenase|uniref:Gfo/Idh/MocA family protein n=1 Tax=Cognatiluteimonas telluris TaxID=1104775 RepID=UPI00140B8ED8|nr:Gfo/Idh/MocA family oxidoreductase [Lysobacter telluris]
MKTLRIVVVGPGLIGKQHIRLIGARPDCALLAIVAPDHEANHSVARDHGVPLFTDMDECGTLGHIDGVIVSSPNQFHAQQATWCIEAGVPVLVEKPITASVDEGEALVALAERHRAKVLVGHHRAHSPLLARARDVIASGRLGRLVSVMGSAQFHKPSAYFAAGPWRTQPGGGPILINLIHEIGNLRSLCGEITAVQAFSSSALRGHAVEDTVAINLRFANGVLGNFMLSDTAACARSWEQTSRENPVYPTYPDEDCYVVAGTQGYLSVPTFRLKYHPEGIEPSWWEPFVEETLDVNRQDPLACQLEHFVQVMRGIAEPLVSESDGLRNLKITEAIARSADEGRIIET